MPEASATPAAPLTPAEKAAAAHTERQDLFAAQSEHANRIKLENLGRAHPAVRVLLTQLEGLTKDGAALAEALGKAKDSLEASALRITALEADKAALISSDAAKSSQITALEADKAATAAELTEIRKQLKAALSKKAPAAGDASTAASA